MEIRATTTRLVTSLAAVALALGLTACGGGGGGGGAAVPSGPGPAQSPVPVRTPTAPPGAVPTPSPVPTASPGPIATPTPSSPAATPTPLVPGSVGGSVVTGPQGAAFAHRRLPRTALPSRPIAGAVVVVGPVPVLGATAPPAAPLGDVAATTDANGVFSLVPAAPPSSPSAAAPLVLPGANPGRIAAPAAGYYVSVFAPGTDGTSAGLPLPYHGFLPVAAGSLGTVRISAATSVEAFFLADANAFRASKGLAPLSFDELAQEAARAHAGDEGAAPAYVCNYDRANLGATSRYLEFGGLGSNDENVGAVPGSSPTAYAAADTTFAAEGPGGAEYENLVDPTRAWAGLAAVTGSDGNTYIAQELVTPGSGVSRSYPVSATCPTGTTANGS